MGRNVLIILGAVAVILIGGFLAYYLYNNQTNNSASPTPQPTGQETPTTQPIVPEPTIGTSSAEVEENLVTIGSSGFSPKVINIKIGASVSWKNTDTTTHNVSSEPHPTHTTYPKLNLGNIQAGASKSLTFTEAGTYKYHDHLNPSSTGQVVVK